MSIGEYGELDGLGMAELVRNGDVTPLELVEEAISRIEVLNPKLNAVVLKMYDHAREIAKAGPPQGAFCGVPFLLKDMTSHYEGFPTTHGSKFIADVVGPSDHDSVLVKRFKQAGLVTVAKTNTPELALSATTEPTFRGPSRNPWALNSTTGGSSGGSSSAVAARIVPIGHGGDGAGSLRIPASACGLVGLKPSRMRMPHGPDCSSIWESCCSEFVMTRTVRDTAHLLDEVAGQDLGAYFTAPAQERPFADEIESDPRSLKIAYSARGPTNFDTHPDCIAALEHAVKLCADLGHDMEEATPQMSEEFVEALDEAFWGTLAIDTACDIDELSAIVGREATADDFEPANWSFAELGRSYSAVDAARFKRVLHQVARHVAPFFEEYDFYMSPTLGSPPVAIGTISPLMLDSQAYFRLMSEFIPFTKLFNITGATAISLPLWWNEQNVPIGVQFVTKMGGEGPLLKLAAQIERAGPWDHRRPPVID